MKIVVVGKGGVGKTTVAGTLARGLAQEGRQVLALDGDVNPMLGIAVGLGPECTERLLGARQALEAKQLDHEPTVEGMVEMFGADAPEGVRVVVASRIDDFDPG